MFLVSFAVDGVERGQTRFRVLLGKSSDAIVTVCTIVGGCYHKSCNVGDEGLGYLGCLQYELVLKVLLVLQGVLHWPAAASALHC